MRVWPWNQVADMGKNGRLLGIWRIVHMVANVTQAGGETVHEPKSK